MRKGIYYEIGAGWPVGGFLLSEGWQKADNSKVLTSDIIRAFSDVSFFDGYFVETVPKQVSDLIEKFHSFHNAHVVQAAVSGAIGIEKVNVANKRMANLETTQVWDMEKSQPKPDITTFFTTCINLDTLFEQLKATPDFLRIDIEGAEVATLMAYNFASKPKCIIVDHHHINAKSVNNILTAQGYECTPHPNIPEDVIGILNDTR